MSLVDTGSVALPWLAPPQLFRPAVSTRGEGYMSREDQIADEQAFAEFVASRGQALVRLARGLLRDPHQAEDIVQDVLAKVLVQWTRVSAADDSDAYVRRMVVNACTSWFRRAARREWAHDVSTMPDRVIADHSSGLAERDRVVALLRRLPARQRAVLVLRHYEGWADASIAEALGVSEVTVRTNAHRGLAGLRRLLTEDDASDLLQGR